MSFPSVQAYEHATLRVDDIGAARAFCLEALGLIELDRIDEVLFLGCGYNESYDLALRPGGTGVDEFALKVSAEELERLSRSLESTGLAAERRTGDAPGVVDALRLTLPGGHRMGFVVPADPRPLETYRPARAVNAVAPLDADHINLMAEDVGALAQVLCEALGFRASDLTQDADTGTQLAAWLRRSRGHHDVGVSAGRAGETLHHVAFAYSGIDHLKTALDVLSAQGHRLEIGLGRHPVGANLFAYLWTPGGNRFELCAEGAILTDDAPARTWPSMRETLNAWSDAPPPESFRSGS